MPDYRILVFNGTELLRDGSPAFTSGQTNATRTAGEFTLGSGATGRTVTIRDDATGSFGNPRQPETANDALLFQDGTGRRQLLQTETTFQYFTNTSGATATRTFQPGATVQSELAFTFDTGYRVLAIRLDQNPTDTTPGLTVGYTIVPPPGQPAIPPGGVFGRPVAFDNVTAPYADIACFVAGTMIGTPHGARPVESLNVGDEVAGEAAAHRVIWIGEIAFPSAEVADRPELWAIRIPAGALGATRDLAVSPHHRILLSSSRAELLFGESDVLVPAKALLGHFGVTRVRPNGDLRYHHFACAEHVVVRANGVAAESLYPAAANADHLGAMLAELRAVAAAGAGAPPAHPLLTVREATLLIAELASDSANAA